jgi:AcrR family transcriptional regulator
MATAADVLQDGRAERRTQAERRSEAERRLIKAAVDIVATQGLERFTLAEVGEAAGYSRGLPAHYFGSKDGLVAALAEHIVGGFGVGLGRVEKHTPGLERLCGIVSFYFDSAAQSPTTTRALFAVLGDAVTNRALSVRIAQLNAHSVEAFEANLKAGVAAGDIRKTVNARAQARLILSGLRGAVGQWLIDPETIDLRALKTEFLSSLKRNLAP